MSEGHLKLNNEKLNKLFDALPTGMVIHLSIEKQGMADSDSILSIRWAGSDGDRFWRGGYTIDEMLDFAYKYKERMGEV